MNNTRNYLGLAILAGGIIATSCGKKQQHVFSSLKDPANVAQLKQFVAEKEAQANRATNETASGFAPFFAAARSGDWLAISNAFNDFRKHAGQYEGSDQVDERLRGPRWEAVKEIWGAFYFFGVGDEKYSASYANDIIQFHSARQHLFWRHRRGSVFDHRDGKIAGGWRPIFHAHAKRAGG